MKNAGWSRHERAQFPEALGQLQDLAFEHNDIIGALHKINERLFGMQQQRQRIYHEFSLGV